MRRLVCFVLFILAILPEGLCHQALTSKRQAPEKLQTSNLKSAALAEGLTTWATPVHQAAPWLRPRGGTWNLGLLRSLEVAAWMLEPFGCTSASSFHLPSTHAKCFTL
jgi:hypothetical protein